jgi:putative addiction module component (TIGR02574 family)
MLNGLRVGCPRWLCSEDTTSSWAVGNLPGHRSDLIFGSMSIAAEKVAEVLALPPEDRAFLARQLIGSLDDTVDADVETQWNDVIDRRSREIQESKVSCRPVEQAIREVRAKLNARRQPS